MGADWEMKAERLLQWIAEGKNSPYILEIHPTFRCNLHCIFCDQEDWRQRGIVDFSLEMEGKRWLEIVDEAAEMGVREVRVCGGGEPMYELSTIVPIFKRIKAHGMSGSITTNGTMFNDELCHMMIEMGWDKIEFSIDGDNAGTHDALRGVPGCFEKAVNAIKSICEHRCQKGKEMPSITIAFVVNKRNFREIPGMIELFGPMGVNQLLLLTLHPKGKEGASLVIPDEQKTELQECISRATRLVQEHGMVLHSGNLSPKENAGGSAEEAGRKTGDGKMPEGDPHVLDLVTSPCYEPWYYMQVLHNGFYSPCCNSYFEKTSEVFHRDTLKNLWVNGSHMRKVRTDLLKKNIKGVCRECDAVNLARTQQIRGRLLTFCEAEGLLPAETIRALRGHGKNV